MSGSAHLFNGFIGRLIVARIEVRGQQQLTRLVDARRIGVRLHIAGQRRNRFVECAAAQLVLQFAGVEHRLALDFGTVIGCRSQHERAQCLLLIAEFEVAVAQVERRILPQFAPPGSHVRQLSAGLGVVQLVVVAVSGQVKLLRAHLSAELFVILDLGECIGVLPLAEISFAQDAGDFDLTGSGRLVQQRHAMLDHIGVISLPEFDLQQVERNDRLIGGQLRYRGETAFGSVQIAPRIIYIGLVVGRMGRISGIGRTILEIRIGFILVAVLVGGMPRTVIILPDARIGQFVGIDGQQMFVGPLVVALLLQDRAESEMDIVQVDRIGIVLDKPFEHFAGARLLAFGGTKRSIIAGSHPVTGIIDGHRPEGLLEFGERRTVLLALVEFHALIVMVLRPAFESRCGIRAHGREKHRRRQQPSVFHIDKN